MNGCDLNLNLSERKLMDRINAIHIEMAGLRESYAALTAERNRLAAQIWGPGDDGGNP